MSDALLTQEDLNALLQSSSPDNLKQIIGKVAYCYTTPDQKDTIREKAEGILRHAVERLELDVKQVVVDQLKDYPDIPEDIASTLIQDVNDLAIPILEYCQSLTDDQLLPHIEAKDEERQHAIAKRKYVSTNLSNALIAHGTANVIVTLTANGGADISNDGFNKIIDKYGDVDKIQYNITQREDLPLEIAERLITVVTENLREYLISTGKVTRDIAKDIAEQSREKSVLHTLSHSTPIFNVERLVQHMQTQGRLTDSTITRAVCSGELRFFEYALALRTEAPLANIQKILQESRIEGLRILLKKASINQKFWSPIEAALKTRQEIVIDYGQQDTVRFSNRVLERFAEQNPEMNPQSIDSLLGKLNTPVGDGTKQ